MKSTTPEYRAAYWREYSQRPEVKAARIDYFRTLKRKPPTAEQKHRRKLRAAGL